MGLLANLFNVFVVAILFIVFTNKDAWNAVRLGDKYGDSKFMMYASVVFAILVIGLLTRGEDFEYGMGSSKFVPLEQMGQFFSDTSGGVCNDAPAVGMIKESFDINSAQSNATVADANQPILTNPEFNVPCCSNVPMEYTTWQQFRKVGKL